MSSTVITGTRRDFAAAVDETRRAVDRLTEAVGAGAWDDVPVVQAPELLVTLLRSLDRLTAVATLGAGVVHAARALPDGHVSTRRWLEASAGLSRGSAGALVARGRALHDTFVPTGEAWLAGQVSGDAVREITVGIPAALRRVTPAQRDELVPLVEATVLPVARVGTVADVRTAIERLSLAADPDGADERAMAAYDDQFLRLAQVGDGVVLSGFLVGDTAAGVVTALDQVIDGWYRTGALESGDQGDDARALRHRRVRRDHLQAQALAELARRSLDDGLLGTRHAQRPHVIMTVHHDEQAAFIGGHLAIPGLGEMLVGRSTAERITCDSDVTKVVTARRPQPADHLTSAVWWRDQGREVLYVGRSQRTAPPRLRRALQVRDGHCVFPGCRVEPSRCEAHHVREWERGGGTGVDNMALLCVRHHHAVHEGGWLITAHDDRPPGADGYWRVDPPPPRRP